jgi:hypothetical protein
VQVDGVHDRSLSATFADLPAPELKWEKMANAPVPRLDGAAIQIKDLLYVFAGYGTIDFVRNLFHLFYYSCSLWFDFAYVFANFLGGTSLGINRCIHM